MYTQTDVSRRRRRHWKRHAAAKRNEYERVRRDEPLFKETQKAVKKSCNVACVYYPPTKCECVLALATTTATPTPRKARKVATKAHNGKYAKTNCQHQRSRCNISLLATCRWPHATVHTILHTTQQWILRATQLHLVAFFMTHSAAHSIFVYLFIVVFFNFKIFLHFSHASCRCSVQKFMD